MATPRTKRPQQPAQRRTRAASPRPEPTTAPDGADDTIERISMTPDLRLLLTPTEAARRLSIGRTACYDLLAKGKLASIKIGAARRIPVAALDAFIAASLAEAESVRGLGSLDA